ncbi:MAG: NLP/P60 protein [Parcubacteria group bacterium Gr01-1014_31]|nr:MAG: NLP/P60 protein [Parcubacteria group bacterium Gr01-1014_31]
MQAYYAVGNRCAVDIASLQLPVALVTALAILDRKGFAVVDVDLIGLARQCVGSSQYRRGAKLTEAPAVVDCSGFVKWLYGQRGLWLPRRSIQQRSLGESVALDAISGGDLVFVSGCIDYYLDDPNDGVGHVGIATNHRTVIHAANAALGVVESPLDRFIGKQGFRGARCYLPNDREVLTLLTPPERNVEIADDIKWIVLQSLPQSSSASVV